MPKAAKTTGADVQNDGKMKKASDAVSSKRQSGSLGVAEPIYIHVCCRHGRFGIFDDSARRGA